jgi:hypothetical protein
VAEIVEVHALDDRRRAVAGVAVDGGPPGAVGDLGAVTVVAVGVNRGPPRLGRDRFDRGFTVSWAGNPIEYCRPASVMWCRNAFEQAPESARTST